MTSFNMKLAFSKFTMKFSLSRDGLLDPNEENFRCYITMLQDIIGRYSGYSAAIKGWAAAAFIIAMGWLAAGDYHIAQLIPIKSDSSWFLTLLPVLILFCFWALDSWFLQKERTYRNLYTALISKDAYMKDKTTKIPSSDKVLLQEIGVFRLYMGGENSTLKLIKNRVITVMFTSASNGVFYGGLYTIWAFYYILKCYDEGRIFMIFLHIVIIFFLVLLYAMCVLWRKKEVKPLAP